MSHFDLQRKFWDNPSVNPRTGRKITVPGPTYNKLVKEFGAPPVQVGPVTSPFVSTPFYSPSSTMQQMPPVYSPSSSMQQMPPVYSPSSSMQQMPPVYSPMSTPKKVDTAWKDRLRSKFPKALESTDLKHLIQPFPTITREASRAFPFISYSAPEPKYVVNPANIQQPTETPIYFGNAPAELLPIELIQVITRSLTSEDVKNWAIALKPSAVKSGDYTVMNYLKSIYDSKYYLESKGIDVIALSGDFQGVLELEDQGYDITSVLTAANAAKSGNMELIQYLHAKGADFMDPFIKQYALEGGHMPVIHWLEGLGVSFQVDMYQNLTIDAADSGSVELMKHMIARYGARPTYSREIKYAACRSGSLELVRFLNEYAGSVNDMQIERNEGLSYAARSGNLELVKYLASLGGNIHGRNNHGDGTPREAAKSGNLELIKWMVDQGVTFSKDDIAEAISSGNLEMVKYLADRRESTIVQYNSLRNACESGNLEMVKYVYSLGTNNMDDEAVWMAARSGNLETLKWVYGEYSERMWEEYIRSVEIYNRELTSDLGSISYPSDSDLRHLESLRHGVEESYVKLKNLTIPKNAVHSSMSTHNLPMIRWMYQQGADFTDSTTSHGAGQSGDLEIVKWLFSKGIHRGNDVTKGVYYAKYTHGGTQYENLNILYWLHDRGYDVLGYYQNNTLTSYSRRKLTEYVAAHPQVREAPLSQAAPQQ